MRAITIHPGSGSAAQSAIILGVTFLACLLPAPGRSDSSQAPAFLLEAARTLSGHPEADYQHIFTEPAGNPPWLLTRFFYTGKEKNNPLYDFQHLIWNPDSRSIIWAKTWRGDFPPHSFSWTDLNGDGYQDLVMLGGLEDVFWTEIYLWNPLATGYAPDAMKQVYENHFDYAVLVDLNGDGQAEILDSGQEREYNMSICEDGEAAYNLISDKIGNEIRKKYFQLAGEFDKFNFNYNMPEHYPLFSLMPYKPVKITSIIDNKAVDVSDKYPQHYRWRLDILNRISAASKGTCSNILDEPIAHARKILNLK